MWRCKEYPVFFLLFLFITLKAIVAIDIRQPGYRGQHYTPDSITKLEHRSIQDDLDEGGIPRINMPPLMQLDESTATDRYSTYFSRDNDLNSRSGYSLREIEEDRRFDTLSRNNQNYRDLRHAPVIINGFNSGRYSPAPLIPRNFHSPSRSNEFDRRDLSRDSFRPTQYSPAPLIPQDLHLSLRSNDIDRRNLNRDTFYQSQRSNSNPFLPPLRDTGFYDSNRNSEFGRRQQPNQPFLNSGDRNLRPSDFDRPRPPINDLPSPPILSRTAGPLPPLRDEPRPRFGNLPNLNDPFRNLRDLPPPLDPRNMLNSDRRHNLPPSPLDPRSPDRDRRYHDLRYENRPNELLPPFNKPRPDLNQQLPLGPHPRQGFDRLLPPPRNFDRDPEFQRDLLPTPRDRPAFPFHLGQNRNIYNSFLEDRDRRH